LQACRNVAFSAILDYLAFIISRGFFCSPVFLIYLFCLCVFAAAFVAQEQMFHSQSWLVAWWLGTLSQVKLTLTVLELKHSPRSRNQHIV